MKDLWRTYVAMLATGATWLVVLGALAFFGAFLGMMLVYMGAYGGLR